MQQEGRQDYITWGDVYTTSRYFEQGYGVELRFIMRPACPKGEQWLKGYWELHAHVPDGPSRELPARCLGSFPNSVNKTVPALLYGMLLAFDNMVAGTWLWTEPVVAARPQRLAR